MICVSGYTGPSTTILSSLTEKSNSLDKSSTGASLVCKGFTIGSSVKDIIKSPTYLSFSNSCLFLFRSSRNWESTCISILSPVIVIISPYTSELYFSFNPSIESKALISKSDLILGDFNTPSLYTKSRSPTNWVISFSIFCRTSTLLILQLIFNFLQI